MENYSYTARTRTGHIIHGLQQASTKKDVAGTLFAKDLTPLTIDSAAQNNALSRLTNYLPTNHVPLKEKVMFSRQFATMIGAGIPIIRSLHILKEQTANKVLANALQSIAHDVESGTALSDALGKFPRIFSPVYISMVRAGEIGGILDDVLSRLADQIEKDADLVSKVRGAMIYPSLIVVVMIFALIFIMTVVIPQLQVVFDSIDTELPWNTKLLLSLSGALQNYGLFIGLGVVAFIMIGWRMYRTNYQLRKRVHRLLLRVPVAGNIIRKITIARFARTLGALLGSGIPVLEALKVVSESLGSIPMREEIASASIAVRNGTSLAKTLHHSKLFPPIVSEMIAIGEETGELEKILIKLADFYDKEVQALVVNLSSVIEPLMLIIMGTLVGFIIVSVIGPLYELTSGF